MKIEIEITKDIIDKSLYCGCGPGIGDVSRNCAFARAFNEIIPNVSVSEMNTRFEDQFHIPFDIIANTHEQTNFIIEFDMLEDYPEERYKFVGRKFVVEIPDKVIKYHFQSYADAAQAIINAPSLTLVD